MRRIALIGVAVLVPMVPAAPAYAATNVICVQVPAGTACDDTAPSVLLGIAAADLSPGDDTVLVGPGTYSELPYVLDGSTHGITLQGSGVDSTTITVPASTVHIAYVSAAGSATVRDLTIQMLGAGAESSNDTGLNLDQGAHADHVRIDGTGTENANGMQMLGATASSLDVAMPVTDPNSTGVFAEGGSTITDSSISGAQAFVHSGQNSTDTLSRVSIRTSYAGVSTDGGDVAVDDAVIDLGTSTGSTGLLAANWNPGIFPKTITADHVTIVGGSTNSIGAHAASVSSTATQASTVNLVNSIVRGPAKDIVAEASNGGGLLAPSTATVNVSHTDRSSSKVFATSGTNGTALVADLGGNLDDVDPGFVSPGDRHLVAGSPVVDRGAPGTAAPTLDLDSAARVTDGDGDGVAVRDLGAYERPAKVVATPTPPDTTSPDTSITAHPHQRVTKRRVTFGFASTEAGTFQCKLDKRPWAACTSPKRFRVTVGRHRFWVRAKDAAGNLDATPAGFRFRRVS